MIKYLFVGSLLMMLLILGGCGEDSPIAPAIEDIVAAAPGKADTRLPLNIYYFDMERKPSTRPGGAIYAADRRKITQLTVQAHRWYARQMRQHGYGGMSFKLPRREADGKFPITYLRANQKLAHYRGDEMYKRIGKEVDARLGRDTQGIRLVYVHTPRGIHLGGGFGGGRTASRFCNDDINSGCFIEPLPGGQAYVIGMSSNVLETLCHELGHAFGLRHDWRDGDYVMSYGFGSDTPQTRLSSGAAMWLSRHPAFKSQRAKPSARLRMGGAREMIWTPIPNSRKTLITITGSAFWLGPLPKGDIPAPVGVFLEPPPRVKGRAPGWGSPVVPTMSVIRFILPKHITFSVGKTYDGSRILGFASETSLKYTLEFPVELPENVIRFTLYFITDEGFIGTGFGVL